MNQNSTTTDALAAVALEVFRSETVDENTTYALVPTLELLQLSPNLQSLLALPSESEIDDQHLTAIELSGYESETEQLSALEDLPWPELAVGVALKTKRQIELSNNAIPQQRSVVVAASTWEGECWNVVDAQQEKGLAMGADLLPELNSLLSALTASE